MKIQPWPARDVLHRLVPGLVVAAAVVRRRYIGQELVEELPILRQVDTGPGGMYSRMEEIGSRLHFEETVTCRLPYKDERERLDITATEPVFVLWRRCYDQHGRILDLTHRVIVGARHELVYRYDSTT